MSNTSPTRCVFCLTTTGKRTREHVWRDVLRNRFDNAKSLTFWKRTANETTVDTWPISQFDMTVNAVCSDCNAGWLNELEDRALPVLDFFGRATGSPPGQPELDDFAFWAITRALVRTHFSPAGRASEPIFREVFARRGERRVPNGCIVSIAPTSPVPMEAGLHQSARLNGFYLGHVAISFGMLFVSTLIGGPDVLTKSLTRRAASQTCRWFPDTFWELAPTPHVPSPSVHTLTPSEAMVAGSSLGFFLGLDPCDQFGNRLDLEAIVPHSRRGIVPWPGFAQTD